jgi:sugar (pentulose or hexulose) kinase
MKQPVTAVFDIGKTNKKFFLFDAQHREMHEHYTQLPEITDEDGHPTEDLATLTAWVRDTFARFAALPGYDIVQVNFSSYGASLVHLGADGQPVAPLYNYTKPFPAELLAKFFGQYGPAEAWSLATASPVLGMLNSGLQLYWLRHARPEVFGLVRCSLHLPQYLSYLFSGQPVCDLTSLGCHTGLYDFATRDYAPWVAAEGLRPLQAPLARVGATVQAGGRRVGAGLHDSSAVLYAYLHRTPEPFLLLSTGTWCICLNPFDPAPLTADQLAQDCLCYLQPNGQPVKASRLFLGHTYNQWVAALAQAFGGPEARHKQVRFDQQCFNLARQNPGPALVSHIAPEGNPAPDPAQLARFGSYEAAYHQLLYDLLGLQVAKINLVLGPQPPRRLLVDGGFVDNEVFLRTLAALLPGFVIEPSRLPLGSALGAALALD